MRFNKVYYVQLYYMHKNMRLHHMHHAVVCTPTPDRIIPQLHIFFLASIRPLCRAEFMFVRIMDKL